MFCDGQLLAISQYSAVFSLLGTTFGGDGRVTFGLPDLRGRSIVHPGTGPGLGTINWGQRSGTENITLTVQNMPSHNHAAQLMAGNGLANTANALNNSLAANTGGTSIYNSGTPETKMNAADVMISNNGGNVPFDNRNPYLGIYVSIALVGIFPSRN